ncbi:MAG: LpxL/LpxP family Kdo(2)-lipid IV(A) lauroyl/palmitoleoyl acyltransferase [Aquisalimonadaceae bacterium]
MAKTRRGRFPDHPLHPFNWGQLLTLAIVWALGQLPWRMALALGRGLGRIGYYLARTRRRIARRNLELCFPALDDQARERLVRENLMFTGKGLVEMGLAWYGGPAVDRIPLDIHGMEHLHAAQADGRPVILLSGHFTCVEMAARLLKSHVKLRAIYKPVEKKPVLNRAMERARRRVNADIVPRDDVRSIIRTLKQGIPIWYAGDQDYGLRHSVFAPFFGIPAATITALTRFTRMSNARVVPLFFYSRPDHSGYEIIIQPALEGFPTGDDVTDATRMNQIVEAAVRRHPAQYLWIHRRFKRQEERGRNLYATER